MSLQTFLAEGKSWHMWRRQRGKMETDAYFSAQFFQNSSRYSVHGKKNHRWTRRGAAVCGLSLWCCYGFRWNIEVSYYEQKTFWSLCSYMIRSCKGIEMLVNLINMAYCAMKILPYQDKAFFNTSQKVYRNFVLSLAGKFVSRYFILFWWRISKPA